MNDLPHREYAAELAATLTDEFNSDAVQEFLESKGVHYDRTDVAEITLLVERDPVYRARPFLTLCGPCDVGVMEVGCACPSGDYRPVMASLVNEIVRQRAEYRAAPEELDVNDKVSRD